MCVWTTEQLKVLCKLWHLGVNTENFLGPLLTHTLNTLDNVTHKPPHIKYISFYNELRLEKVSNFSLI